MLEQAIFIGAGFSYYAGLPLQADFTTHLLRGSHFTKGPSKRLVEYAMSWMQCFNKFDPSDTSALLSSSA